MHCLPRAMATPSTTTTTGETDNFSGNDCSWGQPLFLTLYLYKELSGEREYEQHLRGTRHFRLDIHNRLSHPTRDVSKVVVHPFDTPVEGCTMFRRGLQEALLDGSDVKLSLPVLQANQLWEAPRLADMKHIVAVLPDRFEGLDYDKIFAPGTHTTFTVGFPCVCAAVELSTTYSMHQHKEEDPRREIRLENFFKVCTLQQTSSESVIEQFVVDPQGEMTNWSALTEDDCNQPFITVDGTVVQKPFPAFWFFGAVFHANSSRWQEVYAALEPMLEKLLESKKVWLDCRRKL